jgi:hypothetical protein
LDHLWFFLLIPELAVTALYCSSTSSRPPASPRPLPFVLCFALAKHQRSSRRWCLHLPKPLQVFEPSEFRQVKFPMFMTL